MTTSRYYYNNEDMIDLYLNDEIRVIAESTEQEFYRIIDELSNFHPCFSVRNTPYIYI